MTYSKPNLNGYTAIAVIQTGPNAKRGCNWEPDHIHVTPTAYEADE